MTQDPYSNGVASGDGSLCHDARGDADALAALDRHHYHGLLKGSPAGRDTRVWRLSQKPTGEVTEHDGWVVGLTDDT